MEPMKFYFDVRDIFGAPRLALSGKKIWVFLKANLIGFAIYWIFTYLAMVINGNNIAEMVQQFGLYPCIYSLESTSIFSSCISIVIFPKA